MPDIPQQLVLPIAATTEDEGIRTWSQLLSSAIVQGWRTVVLTVNALSTVETEANRPATPELDHIFFTSSDADQTYVAVNGTWKSLGEQRDSRRYTLLLC